MDAITKVVEGSYTFLLVSQVLVVSGLIATLLYLVFRRTREMFSTMATETVTPATLEVTAPSAPTVQVPTPSTPVDTAPTPTPAPIAAPALAPTPASAPGAPDLQERVKFLETKLLEYEILQEEIATLSALKLENEKLKTQVAEVKAAMTVAQAQPLQKAAG